MTVLWNSQTDLSWEGQFLYTVNYLSEIFAWVQTIRLQITASSCADERNPNITPFLESVHPWPTVQHSIMLLCVQSYRASKQEIEQPMGQTLTHSLKQASASRDVPVTYHVLYRTIISRCCACLVKDTFLIIIGMFLWVGPDLAQ